jgi:hypothetical protein
MPARIISPVWVKAGRRTIQILDADQDAVPSIQKYLSREFSSIDIFYNNPSTRRISPDKLR